MDRSSAAWGRCHSGDNDTKPSRAHTLAAAVGCCVEQEKQLCTYVFDAGALVIAGNSATGDRLYVVFGLHVGKQGSHVFHLVVGKAPRVHEGIGAAGAVDASAVEGYAHGRGVCVQDAVADGLIHVAVQIVHLVTGGQEVGERHNLYDGLVGANVSIHMCGTSCPSCTACIMAKHESLPPLWRRCDACKTVQ